MALHDTPEDDDDRNTVPRWLSQERGAVRRICDTVGGIS